MLRAAAILLASAASAQTVFDPTKAGTHSVLVRRFDAWKLDTVQPSENLARLSGRMDVLYMFHGRTGSGTPGGYTYSYGDGDDYVAETYHANLTAAWDAEGGPCPEQPPNEEDPLFDGYTIRRCATTGEPPQYKSLFNWFATRSGEPSWLDSYTLGESPKLESYLDAFSVYLANTIEAPCAAENATICNGHGTHFPFLVHCQFHFHNLGIQHFFDFHQYPFDTHHIAFRYSEWSLWHSYVEGDLWTDWGTAGHEASLSASVFQAGCDTPVVLPRPPAAANKPGQYAADESRWLSLDVSGACRPTSAYELNGYGNRAFLLPELGMTPSAASPPDFEHCGITYEVTPDLYTHYAGSAPMLNVYICMRRRPTKALFYNFLVLFSTLLCMYCFFVFDYFEASGSDVVDDIQLFSACGVAISVLVFFSLSVGNDLPRHTSLTYMEAVHASGFALVSVALLWLLARYSIQQHDVEEERRCGRREALQQTDAGAQAETSVGFCGTSSLCASPPPSPPPPRSRPTRGRVHRGAAAAANMGKGMIQSKKAFLIGWPLLVIASQILILGLYGLL